jgi:hypothetical protein
MKLIAVGVHKFYLIKKVLFKDFFLYLFEKKKIRLQKKFLLSFAVMFEALQRRLSHGTTCIVVTMMVCNRPSLFFFFLFSLPSQLNFVQAIKKI